MVIDMTFQKSLTVFFKEKNVLDFVLQITHVFEEKLFPRNFYLGKADYIFTLTFAAEVCLKVTTTNSPLQQPIICEAEHCVLLRLL